MLTKSSYVSQSEADMYLSCERKHYYAFGEPVVNEEGVWRHGLSPTHYGTALTRGLIGHEGLAAFYRAIQSGESLDVAKGIASQTMFDQIDADFDPKVFDVITLVDKYIDEHGYDTQNYRILAVEETYEYDGFPFTVDLIKRNRRTGETILVDHKFIANFYQERLFPIMPQLAKYKYALTQLGKKIDRCEYNMLSTRSNASTLFKTVNATPSDEKCATFWREQKRVASKILALKNLPTTEEWKNATTRSASAFNCQNCQFLDICTTDIEGLRGRDLLVRSSYVPNSYAGKYDA